MHVGVGEDDLGVWVGWSVDVQPVEGVVQFCCGGIAVEIGLAASPEVSLWEGGEIEACYDSKVITASSGVCVSAGLWGKYGNRASETYLVSMLELGSP